MYHDAAGPLQACSGRSDSKKGRRDLAGNNKTLVSPFELTLKALAAFLWIKGHQNFLGHRSGAKTEKVHSWELKNFKSRSIRMNGGKTYSFPSGEISWAKTLVPKGWAKGNGEKNLRGRPARSACMLNGRAVILMMWVPKAESAWCRAEGLKEQSRSE